MENRDSNNDEVADTVEESILKAIWQSKFSENFSSIKSIQKVVHIDHVYFKWLERNYKGTHVYGIVGLKHDQDNPILNISCERCISIRTAVARANAEYLRKYGEYLRQYGIKY